MYADGREWLAEPGKAKARLRGELLARRRAMSDGQRTTASAAICARLEERLSGSGLVMAYAPIRGEVDPLPFVRRLLAKGVQVAFPVVRERELIARSVSDLAQLAPAAFGILEPVPDRPEVQPGQIDVVLVPALTYDLKGFRLGYGGGYYDRFLPRLGPETMTVGLAYDHLVVESLPVEAHDRPVRWVVTETGWLGPFEGGEEAL